MLRKNHILLFPLMIGILGACASQPPTRLENETSLREIIQEQRQQATEAAPQDDTARQDNAIQTTPDTSPSTPAPPIWETTADKQGLRHIASGLICPAILADFKMTAEESFDGLGHGKDVACAYAAQEGGAVKLHLTDFGRTVSPAAHLKGVETTIKDTFKVTASANVPALPDTAPINNASAFRLAAISELRPDIPVHTGIWIEQVGAWHVKVRATYEADRMPAIATLVDTLYANARRTIRQPDRLQLPDGIGG